MSGFTVVGRFSGAVFVHRQAANEGLQRKCRIANARPEPDFKYRSNATARASSSKRITTTKRHGLCLAVCGTSPTLCLTKRSPKSAVMPT